MYIFRPEPKNVLRKDSKASDACATLLWVAKNLPIRFFGDPVLHTPCREVTKEEFGTPDLQRLADALADTLTRYRAQNGTGRALAANQIGFDKSVIVIWAAEQPEVLVNPKLLTSTGLGSYFESCISSGTLLIGEVRRPWHGVFEYQDLAGKTHKLTADEKQTRLILHEMDHLRGETCIEKYEPGSLRFVRGGKDEILSQQFKHLA